MKNSQTMPKSNRVIGYLRVSTKEQDLEKNKSEILHLANDKKLKHVEWVEEKVSGTKHWKTRKHGETIYELTDGDTIIVSELSRLGRSLLQILEILEHCRNKSIRIYAVKGGWSLDNTMQSKILSMFLGMASEIERDLISSRTKEALLARKEAGVILGRPKGSGKSKLDQYREEIEAMLKCGTRQNYIARKYSITPAALSQWVKKHKISTKPEFRVPA
jgi:DNA invertase Pin-like site-specific DNA recombinase